MKMSEGDQVARNQLVITQAMAPRQGWSCWHQGHWWTVTIGPEGQHITTGQELLSISRKDEMGTLIARCVPFHQTSHHAAPQVTR